MPRTRKKTEIVEADAFVTAISSIENDTKPPSVASNIPTGNVRKKGSWRIVLLAILCVLMLGSVSGFVFYKKYTSSEAVAAREVSRIEAETKMLLEELGAIMVLPVDETPLMYEVSDPNMLTNEQPFFVGSEKGDKLFVYEKAVKAILYSPARKKIINVGPITFDGQSAEAAIKP